MVITVMEAQVAPEKAAALETAYQEALQHLSAGVQQTFLLRSSQEPGVWQVVSVWESRAALEAISPPGEARRGAWIFQAAEAEPRVSIYEIIAAAQAD